MSDHNIAIFSINQWTSIKQRVHHFAYELSKSNSLIFIEQPGYSIISRLYYYFRRIPFPRPKSGISEINGSMMVYSPPLIPIHFYFENVFIAQVDNMWIYMFLKHLLSRMSFYPNVVWISMPHMVFMFDKFPNAVKVYDCMDDYSEFPKRKKIRKNVTRYFESKAISKADLVFTSSQLLFERISHIRKNVFLIPNAGDPTHFSKVLSDEDIPNEIAKTASPLAGFIGTISDWFDFDLLKYLIDEIPTLTIVLIGPVETIIPSNLKNERIKLLGVKPYDDLPRYLYKFDVLLIPFINNDLVRSVNPVKVYEYLATGKPVVTTDIDELHAMNDFLYISKTKEQFICNVLAALHEKDPDLYIKRRQFAKQNSWHERVSYIEKLIDLEYRKKQQ